MIRIFYIIHVIRIFVPIRDKDHSSVQYKLRYNHAAVRRGARVVEWDGLENRCGLRATVGSNPTLSAHCIRYGACPLRRS
jgi:hypothetical protein